MSRIETIKNTLVAEYASITPANGYANDLTGKVSYGYKYPDRVTSGIDVTVQFGNEPISPMDENASTFESDVDVWVTAYARSGSNDAASAALSEALLTDIKKLTASLCLKYEVASGQRWTIKRKSMIQAFRETYPGQNMPRGCGVKYAIHLSNLTNEF